ncbi:MAG: hypothetical protein HYY02_00850 [Chloroflexi bacterium]|nr:hypothetical protein [Chloroflexota bacterium]
MAALLAELAKAERWEPLALLLLLAMTRTLERLPPDALPEMLDLLGGPSGRR